VQLHKEAAAVRGERGPEWFVPNQAGTVLPNGSAPGRTAFVGPRGLTTAAIAECEIAWSIF